MAYKPQTATQNAGSPQPPGAQALQPAPESMRQSDNDKLHSMQHGTKRDAAAADMIAQRTKLHDAGK